MNVYIIDENISSQKNGIGSFMVQLVSVLKKIGLNVNLISFNSEVDNFSIHYENGIRRFLFPYFTDYVFSKHYKLIDIFLRLYINDSHNNVFLFNHRPCLELIKTVKISFPNSKIIFTIHDFGWISHLRGCLEEFIDIVNKKLEQKNVLYSFYEDCEMYSIADKIICLSSDSYKLLSDICLIERTKLHLIPNGLKDSYNSLSNEQLVKLKEKYHIPVHEKIIIYVGRLNEMKGYLDLIDCFGNVLKIYSNCHLILAGEIQNPYEAISLGRHVATKISYLGFIPRKELAKWYQMADIGVIPSYYEQSSYVGIEMMMNSLPIISSDGFGVKCMFREGINAKIAKIGNRNNLKEFRNNLSNAILELLKNDELCKILALQARKVYESEYSIKILENNYRNLFDNLRREMRT
jgi:glycosyltransferase